MNEKLYISVDANDIGKKLERYILTDNLGELKNFSHNLAADIRNLSEWVAESGGNVYMAGGDNLLAEVPASNLRNILAMVYTINNHEDYRFCVGAGETAAGAYLALKYAKVNGLFAVRYLGEGFTELTL